MSAPRARLRTQRPVAAPRCNAPPQLVTPSPNDPPAAPDCLLPDVVQRFLRQPPPAEVPSLKTRVLMALGAQDGRTHADLVQALAPQIPDEVAAGLEGSNPRRALVRMALEELADTGRLRRDGKTDECPVWLAAPEPDSRFELDEFFGSVMPPASAAEDAQLEWELVVYGCRAPLILWRERGRSLLVDGYRRWPLCRRHGLEYTVVYHSFKDRAEVVQFIWDHHCGRRNLTPEALSYAHGRLFNAAKLGQGGDRRSDRARSQQAARQLADSLRVSRSKLFRDGRFARALDRIAVVCGPALRTAVLSRGVRLGRDEAGWLAEQDETRMRALAAALLEGKEVMLNPARKGKTLVLPLGDPDRQAAILLHRLGSEGFDRMCQSAALLRQEAR